MEATTDEAALAVTLDDVARKAGVSPAAASRALNGRSGVRMAVRQRVEHAAESLGYRPNRAARNLASGRASVIGLVLPSTELRDDPYAASVVHAVSRAADAADQGVLLLLATSAPGDKIRHTLRDGLIDGVIVSAVAAGEDWVEELLDAEIPTVLVGSHPRRTDVPVVNSENRLASAQAVEHLFEQGCERVGIITGPSTRTDAEARLAGYRDAHQRRNLPIDDQLIVSGDFTRRSGREATPALLAVGVDGIFAGNDEMAVGALHAIETAGLSVPDDVALIGFDGTIPDDHLHLSLSTVRQPFNELGEAAVRELIALLDGEPIELLRLIRPHLTVGETSRRR